MLKLKRRLVEAVLSLLALIASALTPSRVAVRPIAVDKNRLPGTRRRK